ncbi:hypothetical protein, partial [Corynebacterium sp. HMSC29G08]|uniref:hypothetical protein n=1 Tax=Corynebacterium sp. HMSC29G08 TaxID=1581069 RepID=UPI001AEFBCC4
HQETTQATVVVLVVHHFTVQPQVQTPTVPAQAQQPQAKTRSHVPQVSLLHRWRWVPVVVKDSSNVKPP